jgi:hypothetical protein
MYKTDIILRGFSFNSETADERGLPTLQRVTSRLSHSLLIFAK